MVLIVLSLAHELLVGGTGRIMENIGKKLRISHLFDKQSGKTVIVPIDHGITLGPIKGLENIGELVTDLQTGGCNAVVLHKGLLRQVIKHPALHRMHYILHLSASTALGADRGRKVLVSSVDEALKYGCSAVSVHITLGHPQEAEMLKDAGGVSKVCSDWGIPLLIMAYTWQDKTDPVTIAHAARIAEELGADLVKLPLPNKIESFGYIVDRISIPVVVAGGEKVVNLDKLTRNINSVMKAGAAGVCMGRNIFEDEARVSLTQSIASAVHGNGKQPSLRRMNNKRIHSPGETVEYSI